jgi:hypothetical protein
MYLTVMLALELLQPFMQLNVLVVDLTVLVSE